MAKAMGAKLGVLCGSEGPDPKLMWGWEPQWPKGWTPKSCGVGIPNGQSDGSQAWGALWFVRAAPQTHVGLGTPMAKGVGPKMMWGWDPQWPKQWEPNLGCCVVLKGSDPKLMWGWEPQWPKGWTPK